MKKILTSAGIVALGAASLQAAYAPGLSSVERAKPWNVSATLRGFYDDNYDTRPDPLSRSSLGFEVRPSAKLNLSIDQTFIGLSYTYSMRYYEDRPRNSADHSHQASLSVNHAFTERYKLDVSDSFVVAQEPQLIDPSGAVTFPLIVNGNNMRNTGSGTFNAELTPELNLVVGYLNTFYDYEGKGAASYSALLDRTEHLASLNLRYKVSPNTVSVFGYQYGVVEYDSKESLLPAPSPFAAPSARDNRSHYVFVGADQFFTPQLNGSLRLGAQFVEYHRLSTDSVSPYAEGSLTWTYNPGSSLQVGVRHTRNQTDIAFQGGLSPTLDQESTTAYGSITHKITPDFSVSILGQFQHSVFKGGTVEGLADKIYTIGCHFAYQFNQWVSAEFGYNYDKLDSDIGLRGFDRNRVYLGIRATY